MESHQIRQRSLLERLKKWCNFYWRGYGLRWMRYMWKATLGRLIYVKRGDNSDEAAAMRFVSSQTSIPIPRVYMKCNWRGKPYIFMKRLTSGVPLDTVWGRLSAEKKDIVAEQLQGYMAQLRALPPPVGSKSICSLNGGPVYCYRLNFFGTTGPFRDEDHMNLQLRFCHCIDDPHFPEIVKRMHSKQHPLVFTHNDFFPRNIIVDEATGKVVAILDWECAGWFPAHWEYCKCHWQPFEDEEKDWREIYIPKIVPVYKEEEEADRWLLWQGHFMRGAEELVPWDHAP